MIVELYVNNITKANFFHRVILLYNIFVDVVYRATSIFI